MRMHNTLMASRTGVLLIAPLSIFILASYVAFAIMAIAQGASGGAVLWGFGSFYTAPGLGGFLLWTALALASIGALNILSELRAHR